MKRFLTYIAFDDIVWVSRDVTSQAEVTDLSHSALGEKNVSCRQVSVNTLQTQTNHEHRNTGPNTHTESRADIINEFNSVSIQNLISKEVLEILCF